MGVSRSSGTLGLLGVLAVIFSGLALRISALELEGDDGEVAAVAGLVGSVSVETCVPEHEPNNTNRLATHTALKEFFIRTYNASIP